MRYYIMLACAMFSFGLQAQTTFNVDMTCAPEGFTDVFVTGPWCGWCSNDTYNTMTDDDGDGIYSVTVADLTGTVEYKYAINGFDDQENLINDMVDGASCAPVTDFAGYANRQIEADGTANDSYGTCDGTCNDGVAPPSSDVDVTFQVDMSDYSGSYGAVNLNGSFTGWCGSCVEMTDADADGIYNVTVALAPGTYEYKFTLDGWTAQEEFAPDAQACTSTIDGFTNRSLEVTESTTLGVVCYNSCDECTGEGGGGDPVENVDVTFNVNMSNETVDAAGVYIAGGTFFGWPGDHPMSDEDGDGTWSITMSIPVGTTSNYTFLNGNCGDWNCKEDLTGQACADPNNYNDRTIVVDGAMTLSTCFGACTEDGSCPAPPTVFHDVTFNVNMENETLSAEGLFLAGGTMFGFPGDYPMTDPDGDNVYSITATVPDGYTGDYTFVNGPDWWAKEDISGQDCAVEPYSDRRLTNITEDTVINTCFGFCTTDGTCGTPEPTAMVTFQVNMTSYAGTYGSVNLNGSFNGWCGECNPMEDANGDGIYDLTIDLPIDTIEYKFTVDGWNDQETFAEGTSCTSTVDGYTNRSLIVAGDVVLDAVCWNSCDVDCEAASTDEYSVTFRVDMSQETTNPIGMFIAGSFQGWAEGATAMSDEDGDDIWEYTATFVEGETLEYKYINGPNWGLDEAIPAECASNNNRVHTVGSADAILDAVCFASCAACAIEGAGVTFNVDVSCAPAFDNLFVTGPWCGWCANEEYNTMSDDDGDGIYSVTITDLTDTVEYKYAINGFADQENLVNDMVDGASCAPITDFSGYANRTVVAGSETNDYYGTCDGTCNDEVAAVGGTVLFQVDMSEYAGTYNQVNLNGSFNGWCGSCAIMTDENADGIYELAVELAADTIEYKFTVDGWSAQEEFAEGTACTSTIDGYTNRNYIVTGDATLDVVCWNSCSACDGSGGGGDPVENVSLTFNVNTSNIEVGPNGIYLGGGVFGDAQAHLMNDDDGDGVWTVTLDVANGLSGNYIFLNSPNDGGDWGAKENLAGLDCSDPANFDDRILAPVTEDTVLSTCFGQCSTDGSCDAPPATFDVTFRVDMSTYEAGYGTVNLNGSFNGWCGGCTEMTDNDGDMVYEVTVALAEGTLEYKFTLDAWTAQEEFDGSEACVSTIDGYNNRSLEVVGEAVLDVVCWNSCEACASDPEVVGCTNPEFLEYDPYATSDDGSCSNLLVPGCMYDSATNYNPLANDDDNSCEFEDGGNNDCPADLDGDGSVTTSDLLSFLAEFGATCS